MEVSVLLDHLNHSDECNYIEAKKGSSIDRSIMESVCAFSNEPGLGGGYILLGVREEPDSLFPYIVSGVENPDKLQSDLSSQCADSFNVAVRPQIEVVRYENKNLIKVFVPEIPDRLKPVYFKNQGLPKGALRRIGSSDQRCTELRDLTDKGILVKKGKGRSTYYIPGENFSSPPQELSTPPQELSTPPQELSTPPQELSAPPQELSAPPEISISLRDKIDSLGQRERDFNKIASIISEICSDDFVKATEIAQLLNRSEDYIKRKFLSAMIETGKLEYKYPDMINHPEQAYKVANRE